MENYLLSIDNGRNEVRCALFNTEGRLIASAQRSLSKIEGTCDVQRNSEEVWQADIEVIRNVLQSSSADPEKILCIGITASCNSIVFLDEQMKEVHPMVLSDDRRAQKLCRQLKEDHTERQLYPLTRSVLRPNQSSVILKWFSLHEPEVLQKTRWILSNKDFIRYKLTDRIYAEVTEASSGGLVNLSNGHYDPHIFEILKISGCYEKMPELLDSIAIAGTVTKQSAALTGLKEGTPVCAGYYDLNVEALASGMLSDEELCMIADTWSINEFLVGSVSESYDSMTNPATLSYVKGLYLMEDSAMKNANLLERCIRKIADLYAPELNKEDLSRQCDTLVSRRDPQRSSVIFVPSSFFGNKDQESCGIFLNVSEDDDYVSLFRAVYEGVVFSTIYHIRNLKRPLYTYTAARLSGSIAASSIWPQILADTLCLPIRTIKGSYIGSKGAAIGAGVACGIFKDLHDGIAQMVRPGKTFVPRKRFIPVYQEKYEMYESALLNLLNEDQKVLKI
ncbi:MAG: carbohydrate kinase [Erysipelotrichaceae bacterium]|nr:carbohydrate kinase [Erysipelotrichaceae bacterium]